MQVLGESNPIYIYIIESIEHTSSSKDFIPCIQPMPFGSLALYPDYCNFCKLRNISPISYLKFKRAFIDMFFTHFNVELQEVEMRDSSGKGYFGFKGIKISTPSINTRTPIL